jgi:hypothetical protein
MGEPVPGVAVSLCDISDPEEPTCYEHVTDSTGAEIVMETGRKYEIHVRLDGFLPVTLGPLSPEAEEHGYVGYPQRLFAVLNIGEITYAVPNRDREAAQPIECSGRNSTLRAEFRR